MNYLKQIQNGIDYIEEHLSLPIDIKSVSKTAAMSQWHFQRTFKAVTGETLKFYIRMRRLSLSLTELLLTDRKILDIALEAGFESQESYTRAFKKAFNMTPGKFRTIGDKHQFLQKVQINASYLEHLSADLDIEPEIITLPKRIYVGLKTCYYGVESDKNNIAQKIPHLWDQLMPLVSKIPYAQEEFGYGIIESNENTSGELNYYATVGVSDIGNLTDKMTHIVLPEQKYAKFSHKGTLESLDHTVNYIYSTWLPNSEFYYADQPDIEIYGGEFKPDSVNSKMYYCIPVI